MRIIIKHISGTSDTISANKVEVEQTYPLKNYVVNTDGERKWIKAGEVKQIIIEP